MGRLFDSWSGDVPGRQPSLGVLCLRTHLRIAQGTDLEYAWPRVLTDPGPSALLDHSAAENAIEIVVTFCTAGDQTPMGEERSDQGGARRTRHRRMRLAALNPWRRPACHPGTGVMPNRSTPDRGSGNVTFGGRRMLGG